MLVDDRIRAMQDELTDWRRDLHAHPELGFEETRTSDFVAERLEAWGLEVHREIGRTGVVGVLRVGDGQRSVGLRADMDALPIQEANTFAHRSQRDGRMHACGHDGHTVMLLGAAQHLAATRNFNGRVNFIFQPAEEIGTGARAMIEDGLFERFPCDALFGMHNRPSLSVGRFAVRSGPMMAAGGFFDIHIQGRGTHGARPQAGIDPVLVVAHIVTALQSIVARTLAPTETAVVSVTRIQAGDAYNVIPETAKIAGTVRTFSREVMGQIDDAMQRIVTSVAAGFGATATLDLRWLFAPTVNDADEAVFAASVCDAVAGADHVDHSPAINMASEDFSFMLEKIPGCYVNIGTGTGGADSETHSPGYDFNDAALPIGVSFYTRLVETRLR